MCWEGPSDDKTHCVVRLEIIADMSAILAPCLLEYHSPAVASRLGLVEERRGVVRISSSRTQQYVRTGELSQLARARDRRRAVVVSGAVPRGRAQQRACTKSLFVPPRFHPHARRALSVEALETTESGLDKTRSALAPSRAMSGPWLGGIAFIVMAQQGKAQREARPAEWEYSPLSSARL